MKILKRLSLNKRLCSAFFLICITFLFAYSESLEEAGPESDFLVDKEGSETSFNILSIDECKTILENLYKNPSQLDSKKVIDSSSALEAKLFEYINCPLAKRNSKNEAELLHLYISHVHILNSAYALGNLKEEDLLIKSLDERLLIFMQAIKQTAQTYLKYADYLFLKLSMGEKKAIHILPVIYRKVLMMEKTNKEAKVKLAIWYISAADETASNFRGLIENAEEYIEDLDDVDRFNAYLWYSIYYMKCYQEAKGFMYLEAANKLFPKNVYVAHLWNQYRTGSLRMDD